MYRQPDIAVCAISSRANMALVLTLVSFTPWSCVVRLSSLE